LAGGNRACMDVSTIVDLPATRVGNMVFGSTLPSHRTASVWLSLCDQRKRFAHSVQLWTRAKSTLIDGWQFQILLLVETCSDLISRLRSHMLTYLPSDPDARSVQRLVSYALGQNSASGKKPFLLTSASNERCIVRQPCPILCPLSSESWHSKMHIRWS
jgi:hypothetical protein